MTRCRPGLEHEALSHRVIREDLPCRDKVRGEICLQKQSVAKSNTEKKKKKREPEQEKPGCGILPPSILQPPSYKTKPLNQTTGSMTKQES